jgi:hypothetical protein
MDASSFVQAQKNRMCSIGLHNYVFFMMVKAFTHGEGIATAEQA